MSRVPTAKKPSRRGTVAVLVAISLTLLVGIVAVSLDGGLLQDNKRRVQNAADAAALAACSTLFKNYPSVTVTNPDPSGAAATAATTSASQNGFPNSGSSSVVVNIPPLTGPFTGKLGYAEVIVTYQQPRYFSAVWSSTATPVVARAVAKGYWGGSGNGVIVLDPIAKGALDASGGAGGIVTGGAAVLVNSNHTEAARATGGGTLTSAEFRITGSYVGVLNGAVTTGVLPTPDPLRYLPVPAVPPDGEVVKTALGQGNFRYSLTPGRHVNLPNLNTGDEMVFGQASTNGNGGIYYIDGGGFVSTGGTLKMDSLTSGGIMIYNKPASDTAQNQTISISGNSAGSVTLSGLTSGPYAGMLFWQNRESSQSMSISGQGSFNLTGTVYAANALLQVSGNGAAVIGSQYISRRLNITGTGDVKINYTPEGTARTREVRLVE